MLGTQQAHTATKIHSWCWRLQLPVVTTHTGAPREGICRPPATPWNTIEPSQEFECDREYDVDAWSPGPSCYDLPFGCSIPFPICKGLPPTQQLRRFETCCCGGFRGDREAEEARFDTRLLPAIQEDIP